VAADERGKIGKAQAKVLSAEQKSCVAPPDFRLHERRRRERQHASARARVGRRRVRRSQHAQRRHDGCRRAVIADYAKLGSTLLAEYQTCLSDGLKTAAIDSAASLQDCYDTVARDVRGKIGAATIKLMLDFISRCSIEDLED
jgi:hypothetical protein